MKEISPLHQWIIVIILMILGLFVFELVKNVNPYVGSVWIGLIVALILLILNPRKEIDYDKIRQIIKEELNENKRNLEQ